MSTPKKETMCARCGHREVCKNKDMFAEFAQKIEDMVVPVGNRYQYLGTIDWLKPVTLECKHFTAFR